MHGREANNQSRLSLKRLSFSLSVSFRLLLAIPIEMKSIADRGALQQLANSDQDRTGIEVKQKRSGAWRCCRPHIDSTSSHFNGFHRSMLRFRCIMSTGRERGGRRNTRRNIWRITTRRKRDEARELLCHWNGHLSRARSKRGGRRSWGTWPAMPWRSPCCPVRPISWSPARFA